MRCALWLSGCCSLLLLNSVLLLLLFNTTLFHTETAPLCEFTVLKRVKYQNHIHFHTEGPRKSSKLKLTLRRRITRCETANTHTDASLRRY